MDPRQRAKVALSLASAIGLVVLGVVAANQLVLIGAIAVAVALAVYGIVMWRRPATTPGDDPTPPRMFDASEGAEVRFSEVETTGYDGPKLGPRAKWSAERSRFDREVVAPSPTDHDVPVEARPAGIENPTFRDMNGDAEPR